MDLLDPFLFVCTCRRVVVSTWGGKVKYRIHMVDSSIDPLTVLSCRVSLRVLNECAWLGLARDDLAIAVLRVYELVVCNIIPPCVRDGSIHSDNVIFKVGSLKVNPCFPTPAKAPKVAELC